jgi:hypothetical protein
MLSVCADALVNKHCIFVTAPYFHSNTKKVPSNDRNMTVDQEVNKTLHHKVSKHLKFMKP